MFVKQSKEIGLWEIDYYEIGNRIAELRKQRGLSQTALADKIGCSGNTISNYETGKHIEFTFMLSLCQALDCEIGYLIGEFNTPKHNTSDASATTGLSPDAIEVLKSWKKGKSQNLKTLDNILKYESSKKGKWGFNSLFHYIHEFINADKYQRAPLDEIRYAFTNQDGKTQTQSLDAGDSVTSKDGNTHVVDYGYAVNSRSKGNRTDRMEFFDENNQLRQIPNSDIIETVSKDNIYKYLLSFRTAATSPL